MTSGDVCNTAEALVVIVSFSGATLAQQAAEAARDQSIGTRVIVVDNGDNFPDTAGVLVVRPGRNLLWTPAINLAVAEHHRGERMLVWSNDDVIPATDTVRRLAEILHDPRVGLVGPVGPHLGGPAWLEDSAHVSGGPTDRERDSERIADRTPRDVAFVQGAFSATRADVWQTVGPLACDMPLGADDHDYCLRVRRAGYRIALARNAYVWHHGHRSRDSHAWKESGAKSWAVFNDRWGGVMTAGEAEAHWGDLRWPR